VGRIGPAPRLGLGDREPIIASRGGAAVGLSLPAIFVFEASAGIVVEFVPIMIFGLVAATAALLLGLSLTGSQRRTAS
jgi:hypothetical protein